MLTKPVVRIAPEVTSTFDYTAEIDAVNGATYEWVTTSAYLLLNATTNKLGYTPLGPSTATFICKVTLDGETIASDMASQAVLSYPMIQKPNPSKDPIYVGDTVDFTIKTIIPDELQDWSLTGRGFQLVCWVDMNGDPIENNMNNRIRIAGCRLKITGQSIRFYCLATNRLGDASKYASCNYLAEKHSYQGLISDIKFTPTTCDVGNIITSTKFFISDAATYTFATDMKNLSSITTTTDYHVETEDTLAYSENIYSCQAVHPGTGIITISKLDSETTETVSTSITINGGPVVPPVPPRPTPLPRLNGSFGQIGALAPKLKPGVDDSILMSVGTSTLNPVLAIPLINQSTGLPYSDEEMFLDSMTSCPTVLISYRIATINATVVTSNIIVGDSMLVRVYTSPIAHVDQKFTIVEIVNDRTFVIDRLTESQEASAVPCDEQFVLVSISRAHSTIASALTAIEQICNGYNVAAFGKSFKIYLANDVLDSGMHANIGQVNIGSQWEQSKACNIEVIVPRLTHECLSRHSWLGQYDNGVTISSQDGESPAVRIESNYTKITGAIISGSVEKSQDNGYIGVSIGSAVSKATIDSCWVTSCSRGITQDAAD